MTRLRLVRGQGQMAADQSKLAICAGQLWRLDYFLKMKRVSPDQESGILTTLMSEDEFENDKLLRSQYSLSSASATPYKFQSVWHRACFKIKVRRSLALINDEILLYGTSSNFLDVDNKFKQNVEEILWIKENKQENYRFLPTSNVLPIPWHVISPGSVFFGCWSFVIALLLLYTATVMPIRVAFYDVVFFDEWTTTELCIDSLFATDIIVCCLTAYERKEGGYETSHKMIFLNYLKSWLIFDVLACLPFSLIEYNSQSDTVEPADRYNNLIRLARLPRLYKLLRILRIAKAVKSFKKGSFVMYFTEYLRTNSREF